MDYPDETRTLRIGANHLRSLDISRFLYLREIHCPYNSFLSLPELPSTLEILNCNANRLTFLPKLPALTVLRCGENKLTELPELPLTLKTLDCAINKLTQLPKLPELVNLFCNRNILHKLPELPNTLLRLVCNCNPLFTLPDVPPQLMIRASTRVIYKDLQPLCINETNAKIRRFVDLFYAWKYRDKFRKWLWERIRKPRILRDLLLVDELLATGINPIDIIDHLPVYHF